MVETDRARVYCPAEVLQQEEGWGGGGSSGGNNLSRARGIAGEEASSTALQGQVGCEEGMLRAKAASSLCLQLPTHLPWGIQSLSLPRAEHVGQPSPLPVLGLRLPFPVGCPTRLQGLIYCPVSSDLTLCAKNCMVLSSGGV